MDLEFRGSKYIWSNMRYKNRQSLILERLDRCLANDQWIHLLSKAIVTHFPRTHSGHTPLILSLIRPFHGLNKPFRVETIWFHHEDFPNLINSSFFNCRDLTTGTIKFEDSAKAWNSHVFGNIFYKKKHILSRLEGIQKSVNYPTSSFFHELEKTLQFEFSNILR